MSSPISRTLIQLRKENNLSQKEVATDLGVSQALLSHYEKGIRECGLEFLVKVANYYDVSCDFLLGRSPEKNGTVIDGMSLKEISTDNSKNDGGINNAFLIQKKLIVNSLHIIFDVLGKIGSSAISNRIITMISLSLYRVVRIIGLTNKNSQAQMFAYKYDMGAAKAAAIAGIYEAEAIDEAVAIANNKVREVDFVLNEETLAREYPEFKTSILNLIKSSEDSMDVIKKPK